MYSWYIYMWKEKEWKRKSREQRGRGKSVYKREEDERLAWVLCLCCSGRELALLCLLRIEKRGEAG